MNENKMSPGQEDIRETVLLSKLLCRNFMLSYRTVQAPQLLKKVSVLVAKKPEV